MTGTWDSGEVFNRQQEQCSPWVQTEQLVPSLLDEIQLNPQHQRIITVPRPFRSWDHILIDILTLASAVFQRPESPQIHNQEQYGDTF